MRRYVITLAMLSLAVLAPAAARGDDQEIAQEIGQKLEAEKQAGTLRSFKIDVQVDDGTVWMCGTVSSAQQQTKALDVARRVSGVKQVVNDLTVTSSVPSKRLAGLANAVQNAFQTEPTEEEETPVHVVNATKEAGAIGTGVSESQPTRVVAKPVMKVAQPIAQPVAQAASQAASPVALAPAVPFTQGAQNPYAAAPNQAMTAYMPMQMQMMPVPVYAGSRNQVPLAFAPSQAVSHQAEEIGGVPGTPVPMHMPGSGVGIAPARYDHPSMPGYAWPSYASYPNYAAVTYPKQYSPTAWPYIGPFYPYPQVPLGWRKVTLEWDDGWWMLDFKQRRSMYNH